MEKTEVKRKNVPGTRDIILQIKQMTQDINSLDSEIKECQERIHAIITAEKNSSPKAKLITEIKTLNEAKDNIRNEKKNYFNKIDSAKKRIEALKGESSAVPNKFNTIEKIDKALEELELKLISTSVSAKEETEISNSMTSLRLQKSKLSEMESNIKEMGTLEEKIKEYKENLNALNKELNEKLAAIEKLRAELDTITVSTKKKSPEVEKLEVKITALKTQKEEMMKKRTERREDVHKLEVEYAKYEEELLKERVNEEKRELVRKKIEGLNARKDELQSEQDQNSPKVYDSLIFTISKLKKSGQFSLDFDFVTQLMKNGIAIPKNLEGLDEVVAQLNKKKEEAISSFSKKRQEIGAALAELDKEIYAEKQKLNELPETNFAILKGGFKK